MSTTTTVTTSSTTASTKKSTSTSSSTSITTKKTGAAADLPTLSTGRTIIATVSGIPITTKILVPMLPAKNIYTIGTNRVATTSSVEAKARTASSAYRSAAASAASEATGASGSSSNSGSSVGSALGSDAGDTSFPDLAASSSISTAVVSSSTLSSTSSSKASSTSSVPTSSSSAVQSTSSTSTSSSTAPVSSTSSTTSSAQASSSTASAPSSASATAPQPSAATSTGVKRGFGSKLFGRSLHAGLPGRKRDAAPPNDAVASALVVAGVGSDTGDDSGSNDASPLAEAVAGATDALGTPAAPAATESPAPTPEAAVPAESASELAPAPTDAAASAEAVSPAPSADPAAAAPSSAADPAAPTTSDAVPSDGASPAAPSPIPTATDATLIVAPSVSTPTPLQNQAAVVPTETSTSFDTVATSAASSVTDLASATSTVAVSTITSDFAVDSTTAAATATDAFAVSSTATESASSVPAVTDATSTAIVAATTTDAVTGPTDPAASLTATALSSSSAVATPKMVAPSMMQQPAQMAVSSTASAAIPTGNPLLVKPKDPIAFQATSSLLNSRLQLQANAQAQAEATVSMLASAQASAQALVNQLQQAEKMAIEDLQAHGTAAAMAKATAIALATEQMVAKEKADQLWHAQQLAEIQLFAQSQKLNNDVEEARVQLLALAQQGNSKPAIATGEGYGEDNTPELLSPVALQDAIVINVITAPNGSEVVKNLTMHDGSFLNNVHIGTTVTSNSDVVDAPAAAHGAGKHGDAGAAHGPPESASTVQNGPIARRQNGYLESPSTTEPGSGSGSGTSGGLSKEEIAWYYQHYKQTFGNPSNLPYAMGFEQGYALAKDSGPSEAPAGPAVGAGSGSGGSPIGITIVNQPGFAQGPAVVQTPVKAAAVTASTTTTLSAPSSSIFSSSSTSSSSTSTKQSTSSSTTLASTSSATTVKSSMTSSSKPSSSAAATSTSSSAAAGPSRIMAPLRMLTTPQTFDSLDFLAPIVKFSSGRDNLKVLEYGLPSEAFMAVQVPAEDGSPATEATSAVPSSTASDTAAAASSTSATSSSADGTKLHLPSWANKTPTFDGHAVMTQSGHNRTATEPSGASTSVLASGVGTSTSVSSDAASASGTSTAATASSLLNATATASSLLNSTATASLSGTNRTLADASISAADDTPTTGDADTGPPLKLYRASAAKWVPPAELKAAEAEFLAMPKHGSGQMEARAMRSVLEVLYPAGSINPGGDIVGGAQFYALTPLGAADAASSFTAKTQSSVTSASTLSATNVNPLVRPFTGLLNALLPATNANTSSSDATATSKSTAAAASASPSTGSALPASNATDWTPSSLVSLSSAKKVTFRYSVWFPPNFQFVKGGKLPGLYGGKESCSGGNSAADCWSSRMMWRKDGMGEMYLYVPQSIQDPGLCDVPPMSVCDASYGVSVGRGSFKFHTGAWTHIQQTLTMSSAPNATDGALQVVVDGEERFRFDKVAYPASVRGVFFSTFFGGHSEDWASPVDQKAWFRDIGLTIDA
ncbi:hypothetical protein OC842_003271 [Tilletia horrida]|uniref:Polysaccharide lyase 14 domain-containing protein n=1 Tax=Tilletia horrida TaxID=155126 RepID=A0AAN6JKB6_9BASI|nr:hypothetical protein OC842_003271 [Tilletia horrida]